MSDIREICFEMLSCVIREGMPSHIVLRGYSEKYGYLDERDMAFLTHLYKEVLARKLSIDKIIGRCSSVKLSKIKKPLLIILEMGVCQIRYMDSVPDHAAVNEAVKMTKRHGFKTLSSFVNALLRAVAAGKGSLGAPDREKEADAWLAEETSIPQWLAGTWADRFGTDTAYMMASSFLERSAASVRLRPGRKLPDDMEALPGSFMPEALRIDAPGSLSQSSSYRNGDIVFQNEAAMLAASLAAAKPGMKILDLCAAPGGKMLQLFDSCGGEGEFTARDISEAKLKLIEDTKERCQAMGIGAELKDASVFYPEDEEKYDIVMADLPCSGLGVMRAKPDIKFRITQESIDELAALQDKILSAAYRYVKPGGCLIYSTCTISEKENEERLRKLVKSSDMEEDDILPFLPEKLAEDAGRLRDMGLAGKGYINILPGMYGTDGAFAARLVRRPR